MLDPNTRSASKSAQPNSEAISPPLVRPRTRGKPLPIDTDASHVVSAADNSALTPVASQLDAARGQTEVWPTGSSTPSPATGEASNAGRGTPDRATGPASTYAVGRNKPPKHTQFKPGQCGNPKGRPKGAKNVWTILQEEANAMVAFTENGKPTRASKTALAIKSAMNKAVKGDLRALQIVFKLIETHAPPQVLDAASAPAHPQAAADRDEIDREILEALGLADVMRPRPDGSTTKNQDGDGPPTQH